MATIPWLKQSHTQEQIGHFLSGLPSGRFKLQKCLYSCLHVFLASPAEPRQHPFCEFSSLFSVRGFSYSVFKSLAAGRGSNGTANVRSLIVLGGYSSGGILYQGCCGVSQCYWHWTFSPPLLFRKGLYRNLNIRRKVKLLIWQLETVCTLLCPRTEHNIIHKLEVLAQTISSVIVKCLIARILKVTESQDSSDSRATIAGQKANIPNIDADSNSKTVFAEWAISSFLEWNKLPWRFSLLILMSAQGAVAGTALPLMGLIPSQLRLTWPCRSRDLTRAHPGSASGLTLICEQRERLTETAF